MTRILSSIVVWFLVAAAAHAQLPDGHPSLDGAMPPVGPATAAPMMNQIEPGDPEAFLDALDLEPLHSLAVHTDGRVKSIDTYASSMMRFVTGAKEINERSHLTTYLDLMLRSQRYAREPVIYVKKKLIRAELASALRGSGFPPSSAELYAFTDTGFIAPQYLVQPEIQSLITRLSADLMRTAKEANKVKSALAVSNPALLRDRLDLVPTPGGTVKDPWYNLDEVAQGIVPGLSPEHRDALTSAWMQFTQAWSRSNAEQTNAAIVRLAQVLPQINENPEVYPSAERLELESWFFRSHNMTWVWILYGLALVPLLLYVVFRWEGARWTGLLLFLIAFGLQTTALVIRWYVSGRWPNSNMFEAVTTAAWMGGVFATVFEVFGFRTPFRGLVALGSAAASGVALMCAYYMPLSLDPQITNRMPVLHDLWLYIHTNVIIFSYCLIFMAAISALLYLGYRGVRKLTGRDEAAREFARVGGAGSLIMTAPEGGAYLGRAKSTLGQVLDGTTMILMELSFVLLWAGIVMGAIWADHSWGRPWGWDPKEVFALNTFVVFIVLVHVRLKVRDKGLWTALIALIGCIVMIFNWVVINFTIAGLHSYA